MKLKLFTLVLLGTIAFQPSARTQTNSADTNAADAQAPTAVAADTNTPATTDTTAVAAAPMTATDTTAVAVAPTNPPVAEVVTSNETAVVSNGTVVADVSNAPAVAVSNAVAVAAATPTNAPPTIPLIQFQDVPLDTAIENLARQANINYLLDPRISYGQPDQNGQPKPWPTLSIRWENVTAEQALLALLDNYSLQLVRDPRNKIARITTKDPSAPPPLITRVIQLKYASTSNMMASIPAALTDRRSHIIPDIRTSQLVVVATDPEQDAVDTLITQLDKPTRQVLIETKLVEVSSNPSTKKGIDWTGTLAAQNISAGNYSTYLVQPTPPSVVATTPPTIVPGSPGLVSGLVNQSPSILGASSVAGFFQNPWFLNADGLKAVLSFLNSSYDAEVVSDPRIVTLDNETATIQVTRGYPVIDVTAATPGVSSGSSQITYSNVGTVLEVTPRITANDYIWLKVIPQVSSFFNTEQRIIAGQIYQADVFDNREIEDQVMIPNANTLVMGGLVQDNPTANYTKVPVLGDIPGLGWAFRSENNSMSKDNLLIFITPTIVKDSDFQPTSTDFLQTRSKTMKPTVEPQKFWDSNKPYDWSNPTNTDPTQNLINRTPD